MEKKVKRETKMRQHTAERKMTPGGAREGQSLAHSRDSINVC